MISWIVGRIWSGGPGSSGQDLTPEDVSKGMADGRYLLVDVRDPNEVAAEAYPGAVIVPLSGFDPLDIPDPKASRCLCLPLREKIGHEASLAAQAGGLAYDKHLAGGMLAWKAADCRPRPAADRSMTSMNKVFARPSLLPIFEAMSQLARDNNAINLGPGFSR